MNIDRGDPGLYLLPAILVLLLTLPAFLGGPGAAGGAAAGEPDSAKPGEGALAVARWAASGPRDPFLEFLQQNDAEDQWDPGWRRGYNIDYLISILPDPLESRFNLLFDRHLDAAQRAVESLGFSLDRLDLPWLDRNGEPRKGGDRPYRTHPGVLLFRNDTQKRLLVMLVIGETSTAGVHKDALKAALGRISRAQPPPFLLSIRLLGPTFSGSIASIRIALRDWDPGFCSRPEGSFKMVSGSVTAIDTDPFTTASSVTGIEANPQEECKAVSFRTTVLPDIPAATAFIDYLQREQWARPSQIALLHESNTAYGRLLGARIGLIGGTGKAEHPREGGVGAATDQGEKDAGAVPGGEGVLDLTFPLHVAEFRAAASRAPGASKDEISGMLPSTQRTGLSTEEKRTVTETPPLFSKDSLASVELALSTLLDSLSRERVRFVGIFASDPKDAFFLAREIRTRVPNTTVFLFDADLLDFHQDVNPGLSGAFVVSTYPLFPLNQIWSPPYAGAARRIVFPSQYSQGVYNAALALLGQESRMLEYGWPFDRGADAENSDRKHRPPLWVLAVGHTGYWPLSLLDPNTGLALTAADPNARGVGGAEPGWREHFFRGLETSQTAILLIVLVVGLGCAMGVTWPWLRALRKRENPLGGPPPMKPEVLADAVNPALSGPRRAYVLAVMLALALFALVTVVVGLLPLVAAYHLHAFSFPTRSARAWWIFKAILLPTLLIGAATPAAALICRPAMGLDRKGLKIRSEAIAIGALVIAATCVVLSARWLFFTWPEEQVFLYLRAVNWLSGASPILPALFITVTSLLYTISSLIRLRQLDALNAGEAILVDGKVPESTLVAMETRLRNLLVMSPLHLPLAFVWIPVLVIVWLALFLGSWSLQSYEHWTYTLFFAVSYFGIYLSLLLAGLRLQLSWKALLRILEHFGSDRSAGAFQGLLGTDKEDRNAQPFGWRQYLPALRRSVGVAEGIAHQHSFRTACRSGDPEVTWIRPAAKAMEAARATAATGMWRDEIVQRREAQKHLAEFTQVVLDTVEVERAKAADPHAANAPAPPWLAQADRLIACRVVELLQEIVPQLRLLLACTMGGLLLMLLAVASYPFQIRDRLMLFNWVVFIAAIGLAVRGLVQMNRDPILSRLTGTAPNKVSWNREFVTRLVLYGLIPLLGLLGAQFPVSIGRWIPFLNRLIGASP